MKKIEEGIATVVKHTGSHYLLSKLPEWKLFPCVIRGKLRLTGGKSTNPIAVGDRVVYDMAEGEIGAIKEVLPRTNYIIRRASNLSKQSHVIAANLDMVYLIVTLIFPETKPAFIDRFLVTCEAYNIPVKIILNKIDIYKETMPEALERFKEIYQGAGYDIIETSAKTGYNIEQLRADCIDKVTLFSGMSGVGKSSVVKALDPNLVLKTGEISQAHLQGKHTTTFYEMHQIQSGGFVIDTPGIRGFGLVDLHNEEISKYFPEMLKLMNECRFAPCTHTHEPNCAIKNGVESGTISEERYASYLGMLEDEKKYR